MSSFLDSLTPTLAVFSHPNHELGVFGLLQRIKPGIVYLTDGGGADRVQQTREGLAGVGLLDRARFLNHPEQSFYDALLRRDTAFFAAVADQVRESIPAEQHFRIICDAVEFYNPVHDVALPIVRAALRGRSGHEVFEIPLVHQDKSGGESYAVQRLPLARRSHQVVFQLTPAELAAKDSARSDVYTILREQMGDTLAGLPPAHGHVEVVAPAAMQLSGPGDDIVLRYEWRGRLLLERGEIAERITYEGHYLPTVAPLWAAARSEAGAH